MSDDRLTHLDADGAAHMVDVTEKAVTERTATARCTVVLSAEAARLLQSGGLPKGDALAVVRVAAIQAAKRTAELIPLCHPVAVHGVEVRIEVGADAHVAVEVTVRTADRTGVEMEALTAAAVGGLTLIDMVKGVDRWVAIREVVLLAKHGGRSGSWERPV